MEYASDVNRTFDGYSNVSFCSFRYSSRTQHQNQRKQSWLVNRTLSNVWLPTNDISRSHTMSVSIESSWNMTQGHHRHPVMSWAQNWPNIAISFDIFPQDQGLAPALAECGKQLSVTVRESRAGAKDRGRRLTSTFLPYKSNLKRLKRL